MVFCKKIMPVFCILLAAVFILFAGTGCAKKPQEESKDQEASKKVSVDTGESQEGENDLTVDPFLEYVNKADKLMKEDKHQEAVEVLKEAAEKFPDNPDVKLFIARVYGDLVIRGDREYIEKAVESYKEAVEMEASARTYFALAQLYELKGSEDGIQQAVDTYKEYLGIEDQAEKDQVDKSMVERKISDLEHLKEQILKLNLALKDNPDDINSLIEMANIKSASNDNEGAEILFNRAVKAEPENAQAHLGMARVNLIKYLQKKEKAMKAVSLQALEGESSSVDIEAMMEQIDKRKHQFFKDNPKDINIALVETKKAVELDPKLTDSYIILGRIHEEMFNNPEAVKSYSKYLELEPDSHLKEDLQHHLIRLKGEDKPQPQPEEDQ